MKQTTTQTTTEPKQYVSHRAKGGDKIDFYNKYGFDILNISGRVDTDDIRRTSDNGQMS